MLWKQQTKGRTQKEAITVISTKERLSRLLDNFLKEQDYFKLKECISKTSLLWGYL